MNKNCSQHGAFRYPMRHPHIHVIYFLIFFALISCGEDHVITNNAVEIQEIEYNRSRDYCLVTYVLDVGARGTGLYKSIVRTEDLNDNLLNGHLPTGVSKSQWLDNRTVSIEYNSWLENWNATGNKELIPLFQAAGLGTDR